MKIRDGFVSNSSSSSFFMRGFPILYDYSEMENNIDRDDIIKKIEELEKFHLLDVGYLEDCYTTYVGLPYKQMDENETKKEFLSRACDLCEEFAKEIGFDGFSRSLMQDLGNTEHC